MRYVLMNMDGVQTRFHTTNDLGGGKPQYNLRPQLVIPIICLGKSGAPTLFNALNGLIPPWATGGQPTCEPIARSEGILDKPTFRDAFARTRCLIPADGFYVWSDEKKPSFVHFRDRRLFAMAGIFSVNRHFPATPASFAGLTTFPNTLVAERHHRMPVILKSEEDEARYLDPDTPIEDIQALLLPIDEDGMEMYEVTPRLNRAENNSSDFVRPLAELKAASNQPRWVRETG